MYYIQNGYVGNAIQWWDKDDKGYTSDITQAGIYTEEEALALISNKGRSEKAWPCEYIDCNEKALKTTVDSQYLDHSKQLKCK